MVHVIAAAARLTALIIPGLLIISVTLVVLIIWAVVHVLNLIQSF